MIPLAHVTHDLTYSLCPSSTTQAPLVLQHEAFETQLLMRKESIWPHYRGLEVSRRQGIVGKDRDIGHGKNNEKRGMSEDDWTG